MEPRSIWPQLCSKREEHRSSWWRTNKWEQSSSNRQISSCVYRHHQEPVEVAVAGLEVLVQLVVVQREERQLQLAWEVAVAASAEGQSWQQRVSAWQKVVDCRQFAV